MPMGRNKPTHRRPPARRYKPQHLRPAPPLAQRIVAAAPKAAKVSVLTATLATTAALPVATAISFARHIDPPAAGPMLTDQPVPAHYPAITFDTPGWTPPPGDDMTQWRAWVEAGEPGHLADPKVDTKNGVHGDSDPVETVDPAPATDDLPAPAHDWSGVAQCESSGNWATDTGNGYYGGLQFSHDTWAGYGGHEFAPEASQATPEQQQIIAERTLTGQGDGAWPVCGQFLQATANPVGNRATSSRPDEPAPSTTASIGQAAANVAMQYLDWPYVGDGVTTGGKSPADGGFDCSGLMQWSYSQVGIDLARTTWDQITAGWEVSLDQLQVGDLIFTSNGGHVAMYVGIIDGEPTVIHAPNPGELVQLTPLQNIVDWYGVVSVRRVA